MEVGTEISQKIRSAIKAKLMEIGSYVDDELPDYIMVMVANKKSQQQMSNDLSLFLGANTDVFTTWLHGLLAKLQTVSGDSSKTEKSKSSKDKKREKKSKEGVESKKEKRKISKKNEDGDAPKAKSARTMSAEKSGTDELQTQAAAIVNATTNDNHKSSENEVLEQNDIDRSTKTDADSKQDDIEDVRQLLVTETPSDELAEELEKSEEGMIIEKSSSPSNMPKTNTSSPKSKETVVVTEHERPSGQDPKTDVVSASRKRKCPSSVVAAVRRNDNEDEDDRSTPMVASVVKVTSRKSSVPQAMQANRALLVKAISEAERSIAVKRKIAVAKPISREESPSEIYTPKRKKSEGTASEVSPPPYIPSRKDSSSVSSKSLSQIGEPPCSSNDARQLLDKREHSRMLLPSRERRELISRSRRLELFHKLGIDRKERLDASERRVKDDKEKPFDRKIEREKSDVVTNFKITAHVAPSSRLSQAAKERLAKALEDKERQLKITVHPSVSSFKGSLASRLGKVVVHQGSSEDRQQELEPRDKYKTNVTSRRQRLALTLFGKEVVKKQCEAAVLSVKSSSVKTFKRSETTDSRVVESHMSSDEEPPQERLSTEILPTRKDSVKSERDSLEKDSEDLDEMLKDDVETDLLNETLADEFTLDLDDDEDLIKVVGQLEEEDMLPLREKPEVSSGTRFIVTLDGVDERQFEGHRENDTPDSENFTYNPSQISSPNYQQPPVMQKPPDQATFVLPSDSFKGVSMLKSAPPKIQPFSINLKDSDDEFEEKAETKALSKMAVAGYQHPVKPIITGIVDPTISTEPTEDLTALQKAKLSERCKFWPACAAGAECKFHHPTSYCKTFPNCKFGDKCLFIHPNCKFDSKCTRVDCPFTHTSRRPALGTSPQPVSTPISNKPYYPQYIPLNNTPQSTVCRFYPHCHNVNCSFIHPKPCRFGLLCQSPGCPFFHPSTPTKDKLKWSAQADQLKGTLVTSPSQSSSKPQTHSPASSYAGSAAVSSTKSWLK